ncbi:hypothetical protein R6Q59_014774 [Mikania micrantha]
MLCFADCYTNNQAHSSLRKCVCVREKDMCTSLLITAVVVLVVSTGVNGCPPADREALLAFKAALHESYLGIFNNWTGADCCQYWYGVICDPETKRVADISLRGEFNGPFIQISRLTRYMNGSISPAICKLEKVILYSYI